MPGVQDQGSCKNFIHVHFFEFNKKGKCFDSSAKNKMLHLN